MFLTEVENLEFKKKEFEKIVESMNIPQERKTATPENARWFLRSGAIQNSNHFDIQKAIDLAKQIG